MRVDVNDPRHYIADEGKVFRCVCHGAILGNELFLREINMNGKLETDTIENYEEIDAPEVKRPSKETTEE